jgi:hypothetical protein
MRRQAGIGNRLRRRIVRPDGFAGQCGSAPPRNRLSSRGGNFLLANSLVNGITLVSIEK